MKRGIKHAQVGMVCGTKLALACDQVVKVSIEGMRTEWRQTVG
ncbi:MAG: hypothetical protein RSE65_21575 [Hafnia sp.]